MNDLKVNVKVDFDKDEFRNEIREIVREVIKEELKLARTTVFNINTNENLTNKIREELKKMDFKY